MNLVLADNSGNIGYIHAASLPIRKNTTPYIGCRVLDGTTSAYDWVPFKNAPIIAQPRSYNPERGYIVTANNR